MNPKSALKGAQNVQLMAQALKAPEYAELNDTIGASLHPILSEMSSCAGSEASLLGYGSCAFESSATVCNMPTHRIQKNMCSSKTGIVPLLAFVASC